MTKLTDQSEAAHHAELLDRLSAAGAKDLTSSSIGRAWATFRAGADGGLHKIYRWRQADVYFVVRYSPDGSQLQPLGYLTDLEALHVYCLGKMKALG